jgi:NADH-quinone oxidoreductase subunit J
MAAETLLFYGLALGLVISALWMVMAKNVVRAVLAMVVNFALTGVLYLLLHAPFLFVVQITVYAGAIMVLFLFVVMIIGGREVSLEEPLVGQRVLGVGAVAILGGLLVWATSSANMLPMRPVARVPEDFGSPAVLGEALFRDFVLPFEVVGVLLLAAVIGAVVIGQYRGEVRGIGTGVDGGEDG